MLITPPQNYCMLINLLYDCFFLFISIFFSLFFLCKRIILNRLEESEICMGLVAFKREYPA